MVLPDIDEEDDDEDDGQKLSLTSLLLESSNIVAHIGLGDLPVSPQDTRQNSLTASNDGGLSDGGYGGYTQSPHAPRARPVGGHGGRGGMQENIPMPELNHSVTH